MHYERFRVSYASHMQYELKPADEIRSFFESSFDLECHDSSETVPEIFLSQAVIRVLRQSGIIHAFDFGMPFEEFRYFERVAAASVRAQGKRFQSLISDGKHRYRKIVDRNGQCQQESAFE